MERGIDIIGVPLDLGVHELGLKLGREALRLGGLVEAARKVGLDVRDKGNLDVSGESISHNIGEQAQTIARHCRALAQTVADSIRAGRVLVCLGGDHSLAIGSIAGATSELQPLGCVWLDTHPDANTPQTSPSGNVHGMPVAVLLGSGPDVLLEVGSEGGGVDPRNLSVVGVRDVDPGEMAFLEQHGVQVFSVFDIVAMGLPAVVDQTIERANAGTAGVHVSFDLDVLDVAVAPGAALASACGFNLREATYVLRRLAADCDIRSVDLVGLNPVRDHD